MDAPSIAPTARPHVRWALGARSVRRRRPAVEANNGGLRLTRLWPKVGRLLVALTAGLALGDVLADVAPLHTAAWVMVVLCAGVGALVSTTAAELAALDQTRRRWQLQAMASACVMFMLMAGGPVDQGGDLLWFTIVIGAAAAL